MKRSAEKAMFAKQGGSSKPDPMREKILALQDEVKLIEPKRHEDYYHYAEGHEYSKKPSFIPDKKQLEMGIKVEMEHTDDPKVAEKIAMDHLAELPDYYTRLKKMESGK